MVFYFDKMLEEYESQEKWIESVRYLNRLWINNQNDLLLFRKLAINAWYTLTLDHCSIFLTNEETDELLNLLLECFQYFYTNYFNDSNCQWLFGYMLEVRTDFICMLGFNWDAMVSKGNELIKDSAKSGNIIANILYARNLELKEEMKKYQEKLKSKLSDYLNEKREVDNYFVGILFTDYV